MKSRLLCVLALLLSAGCGQNVGWVIKPAPTDESLRETIISTDPGLFVNDKIALIDIDGILVNQRGGMFSFRDNQVSLFVEKLDKAQADPNVKAVVVRINSPGGAVAASDTMYEKLIRFRSQKACPVIAVIEDVGASGGYYVACGADEILAHPASVTGSIGTIVQTVSLAGTMKMLRIDARAVTSGPRKDMASPFKPLDAKDLAILQEMVNEYYARFCDVVDKARPSLNAEQVKTLADGRVYTGQQALANGLVDRLGYVDDAVLLAKEKSRCARVKVVIYHRPLGYRANVYSSAQVATGRPQINLLNISADEFLSSAAPQFLYLWTGHTYGR